MSLSRMPRLANRAIRRILVADSLLPCKSGSPRQVARKECFHQFRRLYVDGVAVDPGSVDAQRRKGNAAFVEGGGAKRLTAPSQIARPPPPQGKVSDRIL